jgi:hypothetical protein
MRCRADTALPGCAERAVKIDFTDGGIRFRIPQCSAARGYGKSFRMKSARGNFFPICFDLAETRGGASLLRRMC